VSLFAVYCGKMLRYIDTLRSEAFPQLAGKRNRGGHLMLDLIMKNIEWVFSGIGVAVLGAVVRWLWSKKGKDKGQSEATGLGVGSVQQTHSGSGDNVAGNKNVNG
jgi:hypothetical protein